MATREPILLIHGGAGAISKGEATPEREAAIREALRDALQAGSGVLDRGGSALDAVEAAARELEAGGYRLIVPPRVEPWGQTVARLLSPEGLLVGITLTPWMRESPSRAGPGEVS